MSSETSTESSLTSGSGSVSPSAGGQAHTSPSGKSAQSEALEPWQLFTLAGLVGATIVVFFSRGQSPAGVVLLSLIVFAAAGVGVAVLRTFLPLSRANAIETPQILGGKTRAALERDKALVLRSIKELEFDRAMGKISDKDFAEMSARLRSRAARIIRQLDAGTTYRQQIEDEIARRVGRAPVAANVCVSCHTTNDVDAKFCKSCGQKLEARA